MSRPVNSEEQLDKQEILRRVLTLPVSSWSYLWDKGEVRHLGPMAQDFNAVFGFEEKARIDLTRALGITLASIQALHELVRERESEIHELKARLDRLERNDT